MQYTNPEKDIPLEEGRITGDALMLMMEKSKGAEKVQEKNDYRVAIMTEEAEGYYEKTNSNIKWREPQNNENQHIEIAVVDKKDGRFLPGLNITVTVKDENDKEIGTKKHKLFWHPILYHYGENWNIPKEGKYTIEVHIDIPDFPRHKHDIGNRYTEPVTIKFDNMEIKNLGIKA